MPRRDLGEWGWDMLDFCFWWDGHFGGAGSLMLDCLGQVDWMPAGVFFIWPLAVAMDGGRYLWMASAVRPGHDKTCLLLMALIHIDGGGLNAH